MKTCAISFVPRSPIEYNVNTHLIVQSHFIAMGFDDGGIKATYDNVQSCTFLNG